MKGDCKSLLRQRLIKPGWSIKPRLLNSCWYWLIQKVNCWASLPWSSWVWSRLIRHSFINRQLDCTARTVCGTLSSSFGWFCWGGRNIWKGCSERSVWRNGHCCGPRIYSICFFPAMAFPSINNDCVSRYCRWGTIIKHWQRWVSSSKNFIYFYH